MHVYGYQSLPVKTDWVGARHALISLLDGDWTVPFGVYGWIDGLWNHHLYTRVSIYEPCCLV